MRDSEVTFKILKQYSNYLDSQANLIKEIRENKKSLKSLLGTSPNIQACANELEAELDTRLNYFLEYVDTLIKSEDLSKDYKNELEAFRRKVFEHTNELDPILSVEYSRKI